MWLFAGNTQRGLVAFAACYDRLFQLALENALERQLPGLIRPDTECGEVVSSGHTPKASRTCSTMSWASESGADCRLGDASSVAYSLTIWVRGRELMAFSSMSGDHKQQIGEAKSMANRMGNLAWVMLARREKTRGDNTPFTHSLQPSPLLNLHHQLRRCHRCSQREARSGLAGVPRYEAARKRFMHHSTHTLATSRFNAP